MSKQTKAVKGSPSLPRDTQIGNSRHRTIKICSKSERERSMNYSPFKTFIDISYRVQAHDPVIKVK
jgi:hypothetical protein